MRGHKRAFTAILLSLSVVIAVFVYESVNAATAPSGAILIGQIKLTASNGQFVSLYNNTNAEIDMSTVQLSYYNYYDLTSSKLTSSRYLPLSGKLAAHSYYLVSDGAMTICYKTIVSAMSLGFSTTAGTLQVTQNGPANILDSVAWSKTAVTSPVGVQTLPTSTTSFLQRAWIDGVAKTAGDPWISVAPASSEVCDLQSQLASTGTQVLTATNTTPQTVAPAQPAPVVDVVDPNNGLVAPEITEVLPNPAAPQTDDTDEYIELYNPNNSVFKLSGYKMQSGSSYSHSYVFTDTNSDLQPKSFTVFKITDTGLQLSNSEGQVRLLDLSGNTISETPGYVDAPEGQSWSLISDSWQWTDTVTPGAVNLPSSDLIADKTGTATTKSATTKTAKSTTAKKATGKVAGASTTTPSTSGPQLIDDASPLHPFVLVGIGMAAVGYALYEYRKDLSNAFFKLKRHIRRRRAFGSQLHRR